MDADAVSQSSSFDVTPELLVSSGIKTEGYLLGWTYRFISPEIDACLTYVAIFRPKGGSFYRVQEPIELNSYNRSEVTNNERKTQLVANGATRVFYGDVVVIYRHKTRSCDTNIVALSKRVDQQLFEMVKLPSDAEGSHPEVLRPYKDIFETTWTADITTHIAGKKQKKSSIVPPYSLLLC